MRYRRSRRSNSLLFLAARLGWTLDSTGAGTSSYVRRAGLHAAFIWWDGDQSKLSAAALAACQSTENSLHLSLASVWELQIKMQLGKLALRLPLADVLRDQQQQNGLVLEPVTLEDILALSALPALHRDPFDRLIIAQANRGGFHLVTHDPELARYPVAVLW